MASIKTEFTPQMILIPEGSFLMGSREGPDNEKPLHSVLVDGYWIGKYPVTNREYRTFVQATDVAVPPFWTETPFSDPEKPVVGISWFDAVAYCEWLSERLGTRYRLPTEAEWERAARGGREEQNYPWGNKHPATLPDPGFDVTSGGPQRVGCDEMNRFGVYDMSGGVHEWCSDYYDAAYYARSPEKNPDGPPSGLRRASRGGSWRHRIKFSRCAARSSLNPSFKYADYGFRVARIL